MASGRACRRQPALASAVAWGPHSNSTPALGCTQRELSQLTAGACRGVEGLGGMCSARLGARGGEVRGFLWKRDWRGSAGVPGGGAGVRDSNTQQCWLMDGARVRGAASARAPCPADWHTTCSRGRPLCGESPTLPRFTPRLSLRGVLEHGRRVRALPWAVRSDAAGRGCLQGVSAPAALARCPAPAPQALRWIGAARQT